VLHSPERWYVEISGAVQGVGFRPFAYRIATELGLSGWICNAPTGVICEIEASTNLLKQFLETIRNDAPPMAEITGVAHTTMDPLGEPGFEIRRSRADGPIQTLTLPDIATCLDCREDIFNPGGRRYLYPFTNCTNCGPRYSIIARLPYDRPNTAMAGFTLCPACKTEYSDPLDRRFHAQPNCCPECGPQLALWDDQGQTLATRHDALLKAAAAIREGNIVAVKGVGGFLLLVDARNEQAIQRLRKRKHRPDKPLAIMLRNRAMAEAHCHVSAQEAALLESAQSPIVLLAKRRLRPDDMVCNAVAPASPNLGVMLPYSPLHHILMRELGFAIVATSGNLANEPLAYDNQEALNRLGTIADVFLVHDRSILSPIDDSVVRIMGDQPMILRRARGYSPYPVTLHEEVQTKAPIILGVGGHLSSTVTLLKGCNAHVGPHIGSLESPEALDAFERSIDSLRDLNEENPGVIACDLHSDYHSSLYALNSGVRTVLVQHHVAHLAACMAEHNITDTVLGIAWDGAGLGDDGTLWGGEFLRLKPGHYQRIAHLRPFQLPGGEAAVKEPRRSAFGLLWALDSHTKTEWDSLAPVATLTAEEQRIFSSLLSHNINAPVTTGAGRLFDAVAALLGLRLRATYQGQAACELEWAIDGIETEQSYLFNFAPNLAPAANISEALDWAPMITALIDDFSSGTPVSLIAARFHNTLVDMIVSVVKWQQTSKVVFGGGCFQNKYLVEKLMQRLPALGVEAIFPRTVPPNDGGLSFGQAVWALHTLKEG